MDCENSPRQACPFVLARQYGCSTRDRDAMDRSFLGAVGGAATEPRSGAGTAFPRRAPLGSNPGAGCCTARVPAQGASTGQDGKRKGELGNVYRRAGRLEAPLINLRGVVQALRSLKRGDNIGPILRRSAKRSLEGPAKLFDNLGPQGRGMMTRVSSPAAGFLQ